MRIKLEKQHYQWGLTAVLVIIIGLLVYFVVSRFSVIGDFFSTVIDILMPFIYGLVMAYLVNPIYNFAVRNVYSMLNSGKYRFKHDLTIAKTFGTIVSIAIIVITITGVMWMVLPGFIDSIVKVVETLPSAAQSLVRWVDVKFANMPVAKETIDTWIDNMSNRALEFAYTTILPESGSIATSVSTGIASAIGIVFDIIIGIIVCAYFLNIKDTLGAQAKKLILASFREKTANEILDGAEYTNRIFGSFISGKIIDSIIIGIICFVVMGIFGWEYPLLISVIVGICNIIPFFGPFIGAVPSALLLFMVNPMHSMYFIIFIILLQLFDGNVLGPKILGDSTGLASFWILFAIMFGGGLFGFVGMVVGVPVFAVIYAYAARALNKRLKKKGYSVSLEDYKVDKYRIKGPKRRRRFFVKKTNSQSPNDFKDSNSEEVTVTLVEFEDKDGNDNTEN